MEENNVNEQLDENHLIAIRKEKLEELKKAGKDPFKITKYNRTHLSQNIKDHYDELEDDIMLPIKIEDLELVRKNPDISDESILDSLPANNPAWWCKVEDGYILNLLGNKKNKIPYDYDS